MLICALSIERDFSVCCQYRYQIGNYSTRDLKHPIRDGTKMNQVLESSEMIFDLDEILKMKYRERVILLYYDV